MFADGGEISPSGRNDDFPAFFGKHQTAEMDAHFFVRQNL